VAGSWLDTDVPNDAVDIDGYICYRHDRNDCGDMLVNVSADLTRLTAETTCNNSSDVQTVATSSECEYVITV